MNQQKREAFTAWALGLGLFLVLITTNYIMNII